VQTAFSLDKEKRSIVGATCATQLKGESMDPNDRIQGFSEVRYPACAISRPLRVRQMGDGGKIKRDSVSTALQKPPSLLGESAEKLSSASWKRCSTDRSALHWLAPSLQAIQSTRSPEPSAVQAAAAPRRRQYRAPVGLLHGPNPHMVSHRSLCWCCNVPGL
jgi:hypothetical protein